MYESPNIATAIKTQAKLNNVTIKVMLSDLGLGSNTMSALYHGKMLASDSLAKIADYLGCSVDYLLGREDEKKPTPVSEDELTEEEKIWSRAWDQASPELRRAAMAVLRSAEQRPEVWGTSSSGA